MFNRPNSFPPKPLSLKSAKMKKMVRLFNKKKRSSVISYDVTPDAIPEGQRDIPRSFPKQTELYTNFRIDTCSSDLNGNNRESVNTNSQLAENGEEAPTEGTSETSSVAGSGSDTSISVPVERVESPSESASEESQLPVQQMGQTSSVSRNPPDSSKSIPLDRSDLSNVRALKELLKGVVDHDRVVKTRSMEIHI
ncbi:UNVERIFIED_CONTAM: hypothetical protein PYX00_002028 [Menopon gallinae]|uniref:Uncharacterized protein n=1 Tax=Menopon gallinae TaxID=328185 RepID=A0AAW2IG33_9NEOP